MNLSQRGQKHVCAECETRFYDMGKKTVACPKCGGKPAEVKVLKHAPVSPSARSGSSETFRRFK